MDVELLFEVISAVKTTICMLHSHLMVTMDILGNINPIIA